MRSSCYFLFLLVKIPQMKTTGEELEKISLVKNICCHRCFRLSQLSRHRAASIGAEWLEKAFLEPCLVSRISIFLSPTYKEKQPHVWWCVLLIVNISKWGFGLVWLTDELNLAISEVQLQVEDMFDRPFAEVIFKMEVSPVKEIMIFLEKTPWKASSLLTSIKIILQKEVIIADKSFIISSFLKK